MNPTLTMTNIMPLPKPVRVFKLARGLVALGPLPDPGWSAGGIKLTNKYNKPCVKFRVLGVGMPRIIRRKGRPDKEVPIEVVPGDIVISRHWLDGGEHADWKNEGLESDDGRGQVVVDARFILAKV